MTVGSCWLGCGLTSFDASRRSRTESGSGAGPFGTDFHCFQSPAPRPEATPRPSPDHTAWLPNGLTGGEAGVRERYRYKVPPDSPVNSTPFVEPWLIT